MIPAPGCRLCLHVKEWPAFRYIPHSDVLFSWRLLDFSFLVFILNAWTDCFKPNDFRIFMITILLCAVSSFSFRSL